jgi:aspartyl-tRNA(Asn)/glutamyl-tRNA(Gln) amidotransferase subunit A
MKMSQQQEIAFSSLADMATGLKKQQYSSLELTQVFLERIARLNTKLNAYVHVDEESAMLQAKAADLQRRSGLPLPALHGIPIAVKDLCEIEGQIATAGSLAWKSRRSTCTATVVEKLRAAGMIILGKTHMVEFAFGGWGTNPLMGTPRNPWDMDTHHRAPGGSSSGSGVAVAAGLAPAAIGSDTGGSVRVPAAFNGLTGLKTTHGLISLHGTVPLSPSLDTIGPMTRTARDAALMTEMLAGPDRHDPNTLHRPLFAWDPHQAPSVRHLRIAVMAPEQYPWQVTAEVQSATDEAVRVFQKLGATIEHVKVPLDFDDLMRRNGALMAAESHHIHAGYIENPELPVGRWIRERILGGKAIGAAAYQDILAHRREAGARFRHWMQSYDLLLTPALPFPACPVEDIDETITPVGAFNRAINYLDTCAISLPAGFSAGGLPIGVQLVSKPWQENLLLQAGQAFQEVTAWHRRTPSGLD